MSAVIRSGNGQALWLGIVGNAGINRENEIDSRELFDALEANFNQDAFLTFWHEGKALKFGDVHGFFRVNDMAVAYGSLDESTWLGRAAVLRMQEPGWGFSIHYLGAYPDREWIDGTPIPIFRYGKLIEISVLPEQAAAHDHTYPLSIVREDSQMPLSRSQLRAALLQFAGGDNEDSIDLLLTQLDNTQSVLDQTITRESASAPETAAAQSIPAPETVVATDDSLQVDTPAVVAETADTQLDSAPDIVLDDSFVNAIAQAVATSIAQAFTPIMQTLTESVQGTQVSVARLQGEVAEQVALNQSNAALLEDIQRSDDDRFRQWQNDQPAVRQTTIRYRPTQAPAPAGQATQRSLADIAASTLGDYDRP